MMVCGEAQPATSQTSRREASDSKALDDATPLVEWALISRGEGKLRASYAEEIASTIHLLIVCFETGEPFLSTNSWFDFFQMQDLRT